MPDEQTVMDSIHELLVSVQSEIKSAQEANTEAGGMLGQTTHPVKNVDDQTENAQTGSRSSENAADVKQNEGPPAVDATAVSEEDAKGPETPADTIGTVSSATGGMPALKTTTRTRRKSRGVI